MLKKLLLTLGIAKALAPIRTYVMASSFFGTLPALAWVAWKNRAAIRAGYARLRGGQPVVEPVGSLAS